MLSRVLAGLAILPFVVFACAEAAPAPKGPTAPPPSASPSTVASAAPSSASSAEDCDEAHLAAAASASASADIPDPPALSNAPRKIGDAFTVFGAVHALHSKYESKDVARETSIVGVIVASNLATAPACALHRTGKRDPDDCVTEIPSFTIADERDATGPRIRVLGWARNFAVVFDANQRYRGRKTAPSPLVHDDVWNVDVPFPLPALGAKVKVTGRYGYTFTRSSTGMVADPEAGVFTYERLETLEPAPKPAQLGK